MQIYAVSMKFHKNAKIIFVILHVCLYTWGIISIEHITSFLNKYISKDAVGIKFSPDVGSYPFNPHMQRNQIIDYYTMSINCVIIRNNAGKKDQAREEREVKKKIMTPAEIHQ